MNQQHLDNYAKIIVDMGIHVHPGQTIHISADVNDAAFVEQVVELAYERGAKHVSVDWTNQRVARLYYDHVPDEVLMNIEPWLVQKLETQVEDNVGLLSLRRTPYLTFEGVDTKRITARSRELNLQAPRRRELISKSLRSWNLVSMPNEEWAAVVFPELAPDEALEKLWQVVFQAVRADQPDPIAAWQEHAQNLKRRKDALNDMNLKLLHFQSPTCDLQVELIENHYWQGGEKINEWGQPFIANIPTEEVHTMPKRDGVNGWVKNTKPLLISGQTVDRFKLTFEQGKMVEAEVEQGKDVLMQQLELDEGSAYLGEVALVAHSSPISQTGITFHDTLFDENASCHLAFGNAYPASLIGGRELSQKQLKERGANSSAIHIDFMIGSDQLNITGYTQDGQAVPIFEQGEWVIG